MKKFLVIVFFGLGGLVFAQTSKTMYVAVKNAALKADTGYFAKEIGSLALGAEVTVLQQSADTKWAQIRSNSRPPLTGWMAMNSLTAKRITGSGRSATAGEVALAGKGFFPCHGSGI